MLTTALVVSILLPLFFCLGQAYRIYARNRAADSFRFQTIAAPLPPRSILIVSPHPDDESLGASGLMQEAMKNGCPVHVVFLTSGDSFRVGAATYYHKLRVRSTDYRSYGMMRECEARAALGTIGLPASDITFLGYPDQGLLPIWEGHWYPRSPYTSPYSRADAVPYQDAADPGSAYCGQSIMGDLIAQIEKDRPTDIYVTHPNDDHPDHETAAAYVDLAVSELQAGQSSLGNTPVESDTWPNNIEVHYFLVHRGDWPVPQGLNENAPLAPPASMLRLDTQWHSLSLPPKAVVKKDNSLDRYTSQQEMMHRFLTSFVRKNEMFGRLTDQSVDLPIVAHNAIRVDGSTSDWPDMLPVELDPSGDTILRDFQSGGDITDLYAATDKKTLYLRMDMRGMVEEQLRYVLTLRSFDSAGRTSDTAVMISFSPRFAPAGQAVAIQGGATAAWQDHTVEVTIPMSRLGNVSSGLLFVEGRTKLSGLTVDHTGFREIRINYSNTIPSTPLS